MCGHGGHHQFLKCVDVVAQDFEAARQPDVDQLAVFFERPQGFGDSLEVRGQDGAGILAELFGRRHDVSADVFASVARTE